MNYSLTQYLKLHQNNLVYEAVVILIMLFLGIVLYFIIKKKPIKLIKILSFVCVFIFIYSFSTMWIFTLPIYLNLKKDEAENAPIIYSIGVINSLGNANDVITIDNKQFYILAISEMENFEENESVEYAYYQNSHCIYYIKKSED